MRTRFVIAVLLAASFLAPTVASGAAVKPKANPHATYALGHAKRCRVNFYKKTARHTVVIKVNGKPKRVVRRFVACVYIASVNKAPVIVPGAMPVTLTTVPANNAPTTPTPPTPSYSYKAHLDPTFTQGSVPTAVTYAYNADATQTTGDAPTLDLGTAGQLPNGILDLFSDGILACSINVGGATDGGACPINYGTLGHHTVITEYIPNGVDAVTETDIENIQAFSPTVKVGAAAIGSERVDNSSNYAVPVSFPVTVSGAGVTPTGTVSAVGYTCTGLVNGSATCAQTIEESATGTLPVTQSFTYSGDGNYSSGGGNGSAVLPQASAPQVTEVTTIVQCAESGGFCSEYDSASETTGADANVFAGTVHDDLSPNVGTVTFTSADHLTVCVATVFSAGTPPIASNNARCTGQGGPFTGPLSVTYSGGTVFTGDALETIYDPSSTSGGSN